MAARSALSPEAAGAAGLLDASRRTGRPAGDVRSDTVPWARENPVIAPHVLRLTSAVACCHLGFLTECTDSPSFLGLGRIAVPGCRIALARRHVGEPSRPRRMAWTCGFPGLLAFSNRMLASWALAVGDPTSHLE